MPDLTFCCTKLCAGTTVGSVPKVIVLCLLPLLLLGCGHPQAKQRLRPQVFQDWQLQAGDQIAGYAVTGGLGDISIDVQGQAIYAPFSGEATLGDSGCLFYRSAEVPAYMFRLCGVYGRDWFGLPVGWVGWWYPLRLGPVNAGQVLGYANTLQFATLRKQPNGTWALVEPDQSFIQTLLKPPQPAS